jgi:TAG lipase/steryl ester hydrolase/phospholipase A2/LPA acyltransferase
MSKQEKIEMFVHMRQSYGRSALMLSGGGGIGIYHIGVLKTLFDADLLPRIVSGSSAGSWFSGLNNTEGLLFSLRRIQKIR